ncbi:MAG: hypothetical protein II680_02810, partial [Clostridia bacterium]|nr:hypothetical protein [Clostridia bacterium]
SGNTLTLETIPGLDPVISLGDGETALLKEGGNRIGDATVVLLPYEPYLPTALTPAAVEKVPASLSPDLLMGHLPVKDCSVEYAVRWSEGDRWLVIRAKGNVAAFYADGVLVSDAYLDGLPWVIDLRQLKAREGIVKIQPLTEEDRSRMYLEIPFEPGIFAPEAFVSKEDVLRI